MDSWDIISYEATAKNHALKKIKYTNVCVKVYSWIWTLCTQVTQDRLKTVPNYNNFDTKKDFGLY